MKPSLPQSPSKTFPSGHDWCSFLDPGPEKPSAWPDHIPQHELQLTLPSWWGDWPPYSYFSCIEDGIFLFPWWEVWFLAQKPMCDLLGSTWIAEAWPRRPHGESCPPHTGLGAQPTHRRLWKGLQSVTQVCLPGSCTCLHWEAKRFHLGASLSWALCWGVSQAPLWSPPCGRVELWGHSSPLWFSTQYFPFLSWVCVTEESLPLIRRFLCLPSCFCSELSFKWLLLPLWLMVCLIDYSNMSQLTSVQLSCILHIKK